MDPSTSTPTEPPKPKEEEDVQLFDFTKKKKKKPKKPKKAKGESKKKVTDFQDPYEYDFLLARAREILNKNNPFKTKVKKMKMKPVQLEQLAKKKYKWTNFKEFSDILKRPPLHIAQFIEIELALDVLIANDKLKMEGRRIDKEEIQSILKKYIMEYVKCPQCSGTDTLMEKDTAIRSMVMKCESCQSKTTIQPLKNKKK